MSTGLELGSGSGPVASPSAVAARFAADDTRRSACPPLAAERIGRRQGWNAVTLSSDVLGFSDKGWEFGCEATMFILRSAFGRTSEESKQLCL
uniref:Uncharacterized protein n=1 Tax=Oryza punctata TaxID=4537 RepID=A0A0E0K383_ORYPU